MNDSKLRSSGMLMILRRCLVVSSLLLLFKFSAECKEKFIVYDNPSASKVSIAGDWNDWAGTMKGAFDPDTEPLTKDASGKWVYSLTNLEPGLHEYKFIVDGQWEPGDNKKIKVSEEEGAGSVPSKTLVYRNKKAKTVSIAGDWNSWAGSEIGKFDPVKCVMDKTSPGAWSFDVKNLTPGRHEYKFIVDGEWEGGSNHALFISKQKMIYRPVTAVTSALIDALDTISLTLKNPVHDIQKLKFTLDNDAKVLNAILLPQKEEDLLRGFRLDGDDVILVFDEKTYHIQLKDSDEVLAAGQFNNWGSQTPRSDWQLKKENGLWQLRKNKKAMSADAAVVQFKYVINSNNWQEPPTGAPNIVDDGQGHNNLGLNAEAGSSQIVLKTTPLDVSKNYELTISNLLSEPVETDLTQGKVLSDRFISDKKLGVAYDASAKTSTFRVFAPRASAVNLMLFDNADEEKISATYPLQKDANGVWEKNLPGSFFGKYYRYSVDGPRGSLEKFEPKRKLSDLYAAANVNHFGPSIILDPEMTDATFTGWTDRNFQTPKLEDAVISEIHLRDFTADDSGKVKPELRGKYLGMIDTLGKGTGIDELKDLGVNTVEIMPLQEFDDNPLGTYHWGYMTSLYFAPESTFATDCKTGKQITELKKLIDTLHANGLAVMIDVVYNHVGSPNYYSGYDNKYYFRFKDKYSYSNQSGCGNDFKTENPMARKLILDNIAYWIKNYHIDGFRFDLAGLIDFDTLMAIRDTARKLNPRTILVAEPWGGRTIKNDLKGTGWSAWNDDFRNGVKDFARGKSNRDHIQRVISGSVDLWTADPTQAINYLESHDDYTLTDDLSLREDHNGRIVTDVEKSRNKLCATMLFTSLGVPMIAEGQEFLRSKGGKSNSYNSGDEVNSVKWDYRDKYADVYAYYKGLLHLRNSERGKFLHTAQKPSKGYFEWIYSDGDRGLGYIANADGSNGKGKLLVLLNSDQNASTNFPLDLKGKWMQIADEKAVNIDGMKDEKGNVKILSGGKVSISVPPISAYIYELKD